MKLSSMLLNEDYEFNERLAGDKEEELFEEISKEGIFFNAQLF